MCGAKYGRSRDGVAAAHAGRSDPLCQWHRHDSVHAGGRRYDAEGKLGDARQQRLARPWTWSPIWV